MPKSTTNRPYDYTVTPDGSITVPPSSPKMLIHTRQGKCVGIYCDQPAKVLVVETQGDPRRAVDPSCQATLAMINPQRSNKAGRRLRHVRGPRSGDGLRRADDGRRPLPRPERA